MSTSSAASDVPRATREAHRTLAIGPITIALTSNDGPAADWLVECLAPCFTPQRQAADWLVKLSRSAETYAQLSHRRPLDAAPRACFALDQEVISLPSWSSGGSVIVADLERSCFLIVAPFQVEVVGDPGTRRWRFTSMWVFHEIAASRLRRTQLDIHAAAVEAAGRAILIVGPKQAGKTTLSLYLLRTGHCRMIANDRVFAGGAATPVAVRGVPTAVKIRPPTLAAFPELRRGLPNVERPYLYTLDDLAKTATREELAESAEFALSPAQLAHQLQVERLDSAPLGAIVFPWIRTDVDGWGIERLDPKEVSAGIWANLYGSRSGRRTPTLFEDLGGGPSVPSRSLADGLSEAAPGYRIVLGRGAYGEPDFARRLLEILVTP